MPEEPRDAFAGMTDDELVVVYNAAPRPNAYGAELLRRIFERDSVALGMSGDNARLRGATA